MNYVWKEIAQNPTMLAAGVRVPGGLGDVMAFIQRQHDGGWEWRTIDDRGQRQHSRRRAIEECDAALAKGIDWSKLDD